MQGDHRQQLTQLIVVGASAGGVEALAELLSSLPPSLATPVVIAQHLNPSRPSHLDEILGRSSPLPVRVAVDGQRIEPGAVYVVPANRDAEIESGAFSLLAPGERRPVPSIDRLLRSAARELGEGLLAVILSGSGSDGAAGAVDVKAAGGTVIIQDPETATFPSMPRALAPCLVDAIAEPKAMGPLLRDLAAQDLVGSDSGQEQQLRLLLERLQGRTGIDFAAYKRPTIQRRLKGRMAATGRETIADYLQLLDDDPDEYARLAASLLIKVTEFFRDAAVIDRLRDLVLPEVVNHARTTRELRVWCAGCATGEEAYTIAMLVDDALGDDRETIDVRIFATDVDAVALSFARRGVYAAPAVRNVPAAMLSRYFTPVDGHFEVAKDLRDLVIFGEHDLGVRPPFPRLDIVMCRNVLIYFNADLQRRVLQVFAYALRQSGWLVLGNSETAAPVGDTFVAVGKGVKLYRREGTALIPPPRLSTTRLIDEARRTRQGVPAPRHGPPGYGLPDTREAPRAAWDHADPILREMPLGVVTVGPRYEILGINQAARGLLGMHGTALGEDVVHLAETLPGGPFRAALNEALKGRASTGVHRTATHDPATGKARHLEVTCTPLRRRPGAPVGGAVIFVADVTTIAAEREAAADLRGRLDEALETAERLLRANAEVAAANDELRMANEALVMDAEGAQAAREESETLTEELQASNEELETLNEELQASVEELNVANEDLATRTTELAAEQQLLAREHERMVSILEGMGDAVLAVDPQGKPAMVNRAYRDLFGDPSTPFVPEDESGRPLPPELRPQELARRGESFSLDFSIGAPDGSRRWFEARGSALELRTADWAGVVVIRDVSDRSLRQLEARLMAAAAHEVRTPIAALNGYVQLLTRRLDPDHDPKAAEYAASALAQTRHLGELSDRLFDLSLVTQRGLTLERQRIDLVALCRGLVEIESVLTAGTASVTVETRRKRLMIDADAGRMEQVLFNLISNALVHGAAARVTVRIRVVDGWAEVAVRDDGRGIPAAEMPRLFDRYSRVGQAHPSGRAGLGLGLFLAHEIVAAHSGLIEATSAEGRGTTVSVRLPLPTARGA